MPKRSSDFAGPGGQDEPPSGISLRTRRTIGGLGLVVAALVISLLVVASRPASPPGSGASPGPVAPGSAAIAAAPTAATSTPVAAADPSPIVTLSVHRRRGVPRDVAERNWLIESNWAWPGRDVDSVYVAGIAGTTARIILPPSERGLAAEAGRVASGVVDGAATRIIIRDITTGQVLRTTPVSMVAERGLFVGTWLYVAGFADPARTHDGGVQRLDLSSPGSTFETIVNAGPFDADLDNPGRGPLVASPSGRTIVSGVGGLRRGDADIIDATTGTVLRRLRDVRPVIANDVGIYALGENQDRFVDLVTGTELWSVPTGFLYAVVIDPSGTKALIAFGSFGGSDPYRIQRLDLRTGRAEDVLLQKRGMTHYFISNELSTVAHPVLLRDDGIQTSIGDAGGQTSAFLLNPTTGRVSGPAFTVGAP